VPVPWSPFLSPFIVGAITLDIRGVINDRTSAEVDASRGARELDMYYDNTLHLKRAIAET